MPLVDNAVYVDGRRSADPTSLNETYEMLRAEKKKKRLKKR